MNMCIVFFMQCVVFQTHIYLVNQSYKLLKVVLLLCVKVIYKVRKLSNEETFVYKI